MAQQAKDMSKPDYHTGAILILGLIIVGLVFVAVRRANAYRKELDEMVKEGRKNR